MPGRDRPRLTDDPNFRRLRASIGGHAVHAKHDSREITRNARAKFLSRFELEVDPKCELTPEERARRAKHAKSAYFKKLALRSARARASRDFDDFGEDLDL